MLEALADFWKPSRKAANAPTIQASELQIGSEIGFGFVPQVTLSGRRFTVTAINTYQFGKDTLTSFVLSQEKDAGASMIIAENEGVPYIAISRRVSISDRNKLFAHEDLTAVIQQDNVSGISCKDAPIEYKGWLVNHYTRSMYGMKGRLYKGDYRNNTVDVAQGNDFSYALLVSGDDEHALEIERYEDGRMEVYATVYRRMSDVGEVTYHAPKELSRAEVKLVSNSDAQAGVLNKAEPKLPVDVREELVRHDAVKHAIVPDWHKSKQNEEITAEASEAPGKTAEKPSDVKNHVATTSINLPEFPATSVAKKALDDTECAPTIAVNIKSITQPYIKQEIKAVTKEISNFVSESIDCELQVANKIIDEAIRNEMRINDVVRRVIGLPVSQQESVQIPITLTDQDYALLAIRYAISANDRDAIKRRIIEDLGDFSGNVKKKAA